MRARSLTLQRSAGDIAALARRGYYVDILIAPSGLVIASVETEEQPPDGLVEEVGKHSARSIEAAVSGAVRRAKQTIGGTTK